MTGIDPPFLLIPKVLIGLLIHKTNQISPEESEGNMSLGTHDLQNEIV